MADPISILPVLVRKPRSWAESPLRSDLPEPVRQALDALNDQDRSGLLSAIEKASGVSGFSATIRACELIIQSGRALDLTGIDHSARRLAQGSEPPHGPDLSTYDKFMK